MFSHISFVAKDLIHTRKPYYYSSQTRMLAQPVYIKYARTGNSAFPGIESISYKGDLACKNVDENFKNYVMHSAVSPDNKLMVFDHEEEATPSNIALDTIYLMFKTVKTVNNVKTYKKYCVPVAAGIRSPATFDGKPNKPRSNAHPHACFVNNNTIVFNETKSNSTDVIMGQVWQITIDDDIRKLALVNLFTDQQ
jgi:hypothetical protein